MHVRTACAPAPRSEAGLARCRRALGWRAEGSPARAVRAGRARAQFNVDTIVEEAPHDSAAGHKLGVAYAPPRLVPSFRAHETPFGAALPSPFAGSSFAGSPFEVEDSQGRDASMGVPLGGSAGSGALLDADELLRRRTWARVAGGTRRPSTGSGFAGPSHACPLPAWDRSLAAGPERGTAFVGLGSALRVGVGRAPCR